MAVSSERVEQALATVGISVTVTGIHRLTAGASRETFLIDYRLPDDTSDRAVLRRDPPGHGQADRMRAEAVCLRAALKSNVPVPQVLCSGDDAPGIDAPFLIMDYVAGETLPRKLQRDPELAAIRPRLAAEFGRILGRLHRTPLSGLEILDDSDPLEALEATFRAQGQDNPTVEIGFRWLRHNQPNSRPITLVHGDFRVGNLIIDANGVQAVLDWELCHLGNPIEDLGWLCVPAWRFGGQAPVGGLGERDALLDGYEQEAGWRPSDEELGWWEIFGTLKWLVLSIFQSQRHLSGAEHSLELAAIGRRVCEFEYDLLDSLGMIDDVAAAGPAVRAGAGAYRRPSLSEILELVAETITDTGPALADDAHQRHQLRIAANLLRIAGREVDAGTAGAGELATALASADCETEAQLAESIRTETLDWADPTVQRAVAATVVLRLRVSNPRRLGA
ncbi:putative phosphotransferase [Gordonia effusa NBRC 100432]|uniref:Putative phosphotransferase n=1 Tax=Gordonia effusa NBRC 100432 TaxID=1077974 RepID=H0QVI0_9ACTN|nr:phosphotransferase family protein [Gordonia effusa]GAB16857.1 putative phosphotransferase [Gordonia effusa NBRC 100432]